MVNRLRTGPNRTKRNISDDVQVITVSSLKLHQRAHPFLPGSFHSTPIIISQRFPAFDPRNLTKVALNGLEPTYVHTFIALLLPGLSNAPRHVSWHRDNDMHSLQVGKSV